MVGIPDLCSDLEMMKSASSQSPPKLRIGCSGFRVPQAKYQQQLSAVEIQHTFYQPPQLTTLQRWRAAAPPEFEFTLKAWQLITHESRSPTYQRLRKKLTERESAEAGSFKATPIVKEAWEVTLACAQTLKAKRVLFQCPASFTPTPEHVANLEEFFSTVERDGLNFCWEPRGNWGQALVRSLCKQLHLCHVVDPFVTPSATPAQCYFRMHGRKGWRYKYEEGELVELLGLIPSNKISYVFFNNVHMIDDALQLQKLAGEMRS